MREDPAMFYLIINTLLAIVIAFVGWLLKRAIQGNDTKIEQAIKDIREATGSVNKLQLMLVGDYYPRKEHNEFAKHVESILEQTRENVHSLRDAMQTISSRLTILETSVNTMKEIHKP